MNKQIEMAKIKTKKETYYIYKRIVGGEVQYNVYSKGDDNIEYFCNTFYFYKDALEYVLTFIK
jgi:hypothetical protein